MADKDKDDDFDVEIEDAPEDADKDEPDDPDEGKTEAELRAELAKLRTAQAKANKEAERLRLQKKAEREKAAKEREQKADADDKVTQAEQRVRVVAIRTAGAAALLEAGFDGDRKAAKELTRLLDLDGLEVDDDGEVDGLDDAIADLKERYPRLFKDADEERRPVKKAVRKVDTRPAGGGRREGGTAKSSAELLAARLTGTSGRR